MPRACPSLVGSDARSALTGWGSHAGSPRSERDNRNPTSMPLLSILPYWYILRMPRQRRERQGTVGRRQRVKATEAAPMKITTIALDEETHTKLRHLAV